MIETSELSYTTTFLRYSSALYFIIFLNAKCAAWLYLVEHSYYFIYETKRKRRRRTKRERVYRKSDRANEGITNELGGGLVGELVSKEAMSIRPTAH